MFLWTFYKHSRGCNVSSFTLPNKLIWFNLNSSFSNASQLQWGCYFRIFARLCFVTLIKTTYLKFSTLFPFNRSCIAPFNVPRKKENSTTTRFWRHGNKLWSPQIKVNKWDNTGKIFVVLFDFLQAPHGCQWYSTWFNRVLLARVKMMWGRLFIVSETCFLSDLQHFPFENITYLTFCKWIENLLQGHASASFDNQALK